MRRLIFLGFCAFFTFLSGLSAQEGGPSGEPSPEAREAQRKSEESFLRNLDTNKNGRIDEEEVQGQRRIMVERMMRRAGIEPEYPMPISRLCEGLAQSHKGKGGNASSSGPGSTNSSPPESKTSDSPLVVPGFGVKEGSSSVPGFGEPLRTASPEAKSATSSASSKNSSSSRPRSSRIDRSIRRSAESLLRQYDENKDGRLERSEWRKMKREHRAADRNGDGIITLDELTERLARFSKQRGGEAGSGWRSGSDSSDRKPYRFSTPTERLPEGLPDWFARKDADGDGQVSMAEYAGYWDDAKARKFVRYDSNNDGVITPSECLQAEKK